MIGPQSGNEHAGNGGFTMRLLARAAQFLGLAIPPLAMVLQLSETISLGQMLTMLLAAVSLFWIGRIVEGYAR